MQTIHALAAGVSTAADGTARVKRIGTTTRIPWYTSWKGGDSIRPASEDVRLDGRGSANVFVSELATVDVYDSNGVLQATLYSADRGSCSETSTASFTGVNKVTGAAETNAPVDTETVLSRWLGSAGAPDWLVKLGEQDPKTLQSALGPIIQGIYNVNDPQWNPTNSSDASVFMQACIDAAAGAGGGVVFIPPGSYVCTSDLSIPNQVTVVGAGRGITYINFISADGQLVLDGSASSSDRSWVYGVEFSSTSVRSEALARVEQFLGSSFMCCGFRMSDANSELMFASPSAGNCSFIDCEFESTDGSYILAAGVSIKVVFVGCRFIKDGPNSTKFVTGGSDLTCINCVFDATACSSDMTMVGGSSFLNCEFLGSVEHVTTAFDGDALDIGGNVLNEYVDFAYEEDLAFDISSATVKTGVRSYREQNITMGKTTLAIDEIDVPQDSKTVYILASGQSSATFTMNFPKPMNGKELLVIVQNRNSGTLSVVPAEDGTFGIYRKTFQVPANSAAAVKFIGCSAVLDASEETGLDLPFWIQMGALEYLP